MVKLATLEEFTLTNTKIITSESVEPFATNSDTNDHVIINKWVPLDALCLSLPMFLPKHHHVAI